MVTVFVERYKAILRWLNGRCKRSKCAWYLHNEKILWAEIDNVDDKDTLQLIKKGCAVFSPHRWCAKRGKIKDIVKRQIREKGILPESTDYPFPKKEKNPSL
jgi:hypothetical protein